MNKLRLVLFLAAFSLCAARGFSQAPGVYAVRDFGAKGDGKADDTAAFQKALDTAGAAGGGTVMADRGNYFFAGHLVVPKAVTLGGIWTSVPSHVGLRNAGLAKPTDDGTTFLVTENEGTEEGAPFITLTDNSSLSGVVVFYPLQKVDEEPKPYPWSVAMRGRNCAVLDVELLNPYNGIDASKNERHLIRNVSGQPLRRGIFVDVIFDIGRIENVHFNPWWSMKPALFQWQQKNGEAFIFGRTDWQYVLNTFCFGYKVGYKFVRTSGGACNGNFLGIGADDCFTALEVEDSERYGLLICNGEFVSFHGPDPTMVVVGRQTKAACVFPIAPFGGRATKSPKSKAKGRWVFRTAPFAPGTAITRAVRPSKWRAAACWCAVVNSRRTNRRLIWVRKCSARSSRTI
jgi:hypothetical protein